MVNIIHFYNKINEQCQQRDTKTLASDTVKYTKGQVECIIGVIYHAFTNKTASYSKCPNKALQIMLR